MGGFFSVLFMCFKQAPMQGRHLPNKIRHQQWCWRLALEWKCDGARTPIMLTLWYRTRTNFGTRPELRRFFAVSLLSGWHDLWSWLTHVFQQIPDPVKRKIWLSHRHFLPHARSQFELHEVRGTWQHQNWYLPTPIMAKRVSRSQNSNFTRFLKYLEHQKWYLATSIMAKRVVNEKSHHAWACVIGISQPFQLTLWLATALATVTWHVRKQFRCLRLSKEACGAPQRLALL